jgi:hypothetical protein
MRTAVNPWEQQTNCFIVHDEKENLCSTKDDTLCMYSTLLMSWASNSIDEAMKIVQMKPKPSDLGLLPTQQRTPIQFRKLRILASEEEAKK